MLFISTTWPSQNGTAPPAVIFNFQSSPHHRTSAGANLCDGKVISSVIERMPQVLCPRKDQRKLKFRQRLIADTAANRKLFFQIEIAGIKNRFCGSAECRSWSFSRWRIFF